MDIDLVNKIKRLTIIALASDDRLVEALVLKGGNAIDLLYTTANSVSRASYDLDYSIINGDFEELLVFKRIEEVLKQTFLEHSYVIIDFKYFSRPETVLKDLADFWGGYMVEFKVVEKVFYDKNKDNIDTLRRNAIPIYPSHSSKMILEFSKYEYVDHKQEVHVDGYKIYVYTSEMIVFEKVRAICQQLPDYKRIIKSATEKTGRAKDFYDIHLIMNACNIAPSSQSNIELLKHIFSAKKVPLDYIKEIKNSKSLYANAWEDVKTTVSSKVALQSFDFYFEFVVNKFDGLTFP